MANEDDFLALLWHPEWHEEQEAAWASRAPDAPPTRIFETASLEEAFAKVKHEFRTSLQPGTILFFLEACWHWGRWSGPSVEDKDWDCDSCHEWHLRMDAQWAQIYLDQRSARAEELASIRALRQPHVEDEEEELEEDRFDEIRARTSSRLWSILRRWDWDGVTPCGRHGDGLISSKTLHRKMVKQPNGMCPMKRERQQPCVLSELMDMHKAGSTAPWIKKSTVSTRTIKEECRSTAKRWHQDWLTNPTAPDPDPEESADQNADGQATEYAPGEAGPSTRFSSTSHFQYQMDEATRNAVNSALEEDGQSLDQNYQRHIMEAIVKGQQAVNQEQEWDPSQGKGKGRAAPAQDAPAGPSSAPPPAPQSASFRGRGSSRGHGALRGRTRFFTGKGV